MIDTSRSKRIADAEIRKEHEGRLKLEMLVDGNGFGISEDSEKKVEQSKNGQSHAYNVCKTKQKIRILHAIAKKIILSGSRCKLIMVLLGKSCGISIDQYQSKYM